MMKDKLMLRVMTILLLIKIRTMISLQEMCGRIWYPAKVCSLMDVPENTANLFCNNQNLF